MARTNNSSTEVTKQNNFPKVDSDQPHLALNAQPANKLTFGDYEIYVDGVECDLAVIHDLVSLAQDARNGRYVNSILMATMRYVEDAVGMNDKLIKRQREAILAERGQA